MILINLLPPEFRRETLGRGALLGQRKIVMGGVLLLSLLTALFYVQYLIALMARDSLKREWLSMQQEVHRVDQVRSQLEMGSRAERGFLDHYVISSFKTTSILQAVSEFLPGTIWLTEMRIARKPRENMFLLKGVSLPSQGSSSVQEIEKYLGALKGAFPPQTDLVLTTSRQYKENLELTLFTAVFKWT